MYDVRRPEKIENNVTPTIIEIITEIKVYHKTFFAPALKSTK